jgi:hypothetical protein
MTAHTSQQPAVPPVCASTGRHGHTVAGRDGSDAGWPGRLRSDLVVIVRSPFTA